MSTVSVVMVTKDSSESSTMTVGRATGPQLPSPSHVVSVTDEVVRAASGLVMVDKTVVRVVTCVVPQSVTDGRCSHAIWPAFTRAGRACKPYGQLSYHFAWFGDYPVSCVGADVRSLQSSVAGIVGGWC